MTHLEIPLRRHRSHLASNSSVSAGSLNQTRGAAAAQPCNVNVIRRAIRWRHRPIVADLGGSTVNTSLRIASFAGALSLALSTAAGAATLRLVSLPGQTVAASVRSCSVAAAPASITNAYPADLPAIAVEQGVSGTTSLRIALDDRGLLTSKSVMDSSGNPWIDGAALRTAALSLYSAEIRDCQRIAGTYRLIVDFTR
jgi:Gram-negative bacterial TonB protein C-terminal